MSVYKTIVVDAQLSRNLEVDANLSGDLETDVGFLNTISHQEVRDYNLLDNKPQINYVTLQGNKQFEDLGLNKITNSDIIDIIGG